MQVVTNQRNLKTLDYVGILFSVLCTIHCLFLPVLISVVPTFSHKLENEWIHFVLLAVLIPVALMSFVISKKNHKKASPLTLGIVGITFLLMAVAIDQVGLHEWESSLTLLGSVFLIIAHIFNLKYEVSTDL